MPRVKPLVTNPHARMSALIAGQRELEHKSWDDIAEMAGISRTTLHYRRHNPGSFTLDELSGIRKGLGIPIDDLREVLGV